jgi:nucleoid DNA-binding protein
MTKKERNQMEVLCNSDIYRIIHKQLKENGVKIDVDTVRNVLETYSNLCYTCLSNGVRINLPNIGEFYRNVHKGRKEGYYNVPNSRDAHTKFDKNMVWSKEWMPQAPNWGSIAFYPFPRVKKKLREETEGKC